MPLLDIVAISTQFCFTYLLGGVTAMPCGPCVAEPCTFLVIFNP